VRCQSVRCACAADGRLDIRVSIVSRWSSWLKLSGGSRCFSDLPGVGTAMGPNIPVQWVPVLCI